MSLETEVKKLTAAMVQLTDAFNEWRSNPDVVVSAVDKVADAVEPQLKEIFKNTPASEAQVVTPSDNFTGMGGEIVVPVDKPTPAPTPATEPAAAANYTFEHLNEILGTIAGKMGDQGAAIRGLMAEYNAPTLMQIPPEKYGEVITRAQALQS